MISRPYGVPEFLEAFYPTTSDENVLYEEALTYTSNIPNYNNKRLALVGDAVIDVIFTEYLYKKHINDRKIKLTPICNQLHKNEIFAQISENLGLDKYVANTQIVPNWEELRAGAFEALFGAVYLSRGFEGVKELAKRINLIEKAITLTGL